MFHENRRPPLKTNRNEQTEHVLPQHPSQQKDYFGTENFSTHFLSHEFEFSTRQVVQSLLESPDVPQNKGVMELQVEGNLDPHSP